MKYLKVRNTVLYVLGIIEVLLAFRFIFKFLGANPASVFVKIIYSLTGIFISIFAGIFRPYTSVGLVSSSVIEPSVIIAMIVYSIAAWGVIKLIKIKLLENH